MAGLDDEVEDLVDRLVDLDRPDPDARDHHLVDLLVPELDDPVDHLLLGFLDLALAEPVSTRSFSSSTERSPAWGVPGRRTARTMNPLIVVDEPDERVAGSAR